MSQSRNKQPSREKRFEQYVKFDVVDNHDYWVGKVHCVWGSHDGDDVLFLGVRTGWLALGHTHVVPAQGTEVNEEMETIKLPYSEDFVKEAPVFDCDMEMSERIEQEVNAYYGSAPHAQSTAPAKKTSARPASPRRGPDEVRMKLREEQLKVGKREVEAGGVRLRKVVRTEIVQQPVEIKHEELVVEHVPPGECQPAGKNLGEQETYIPLHREEPVIEKEVRTRDEVRVRRIVRKELETVSGEVRREDVEVEARPNAERGEPGRC
jgi:uncharacterized protein (TIGR02271 family)